MADVNVFLGQSDFHAAGLALATGLPTYVLDPYFNEVREVTEISQKIQKKATLAIYAAADMQTFGVIVGLKEVHEVPTGTQPRLGVQDVPCQIR